jgi:hypothetical protein
MQMLNDPLKDPAGITDAQESFLEKLMRLIKEGVLDPMRPSTIINTAVYDALPDEAKGKVDLEAVNMSSAIREIRDLFESGNAESFQLQNRIDSLREIKTRLEKEGGDLFII